MILFIKDNTPRDYQAARRFKRCAFLAGNCK
nr:MAG TPA: hypothetical protein [Caudoviricetes sp.]